MAESIFNAVAGSLNSDFSVKQLTGFTPLMSSELNTTYTSSTYSDLANAKILWCLCGALDTSLNTVTIFVDRSCANCRAAFRSKPLTTDTDVVSYDLNFKPETNQLQFRIGEKGSNVSWSGIRKVFYI